MNRQLPFILSQALVIILYLIPQFCVKFEIAVSDSLKYDWWFAYIISWLIFLAFVTLEILHCHERRTSERRKSQPSTK